MFADFVSVTPGSTGTIAKATTVPTVEFTQTWTINTSCKFARIMAHVPALGACATQDGAAETAPWRLRAPRSAMATAFVPVAPGDALDRLVAMSASATGHLHSCGLVTPATYSSVREISFSMGLSSNPAAVKAIACRMRTRNCPNALASSTVQVAVVCPTLIVAHLHSTST